MAQEEVSYAAQYEDLHLLRVISGMCDQSHDPEPWTTRSIAQQNVVNSHKLNSESMGRGYGG